MSLSSELTDPALLAELGRRLARTRLERNLTQPQLAEAASVGLNTLKRLEAGEGATLLNFLRVLRALDLLGGLEQVLPEPTPSPMQQLLLGGRRRKRGSGRHLAGSPEPSDRAEPREWRWGDEAPR